MRVKVRKDDKRTVDIWVDDIRPAPDDHWLVCKTFREGIAALSWLDKRWSVDIGTVALDHDLGEEKSGYDIAKFIVEKDIPINDFYCQSQNVVGKENIRQLLTHYGYKERRTL